MPQLITVGQYVQTGRPDTLAVPLDAAPVTPGTYQNYAAGQLGSHFNVQGRQYMLCILDPAWVVGNAAGAVVAGQVAYWVDKSKRYVTNDITACIASGAPAMAVAGVFMVALSTNGAGGTLVAILTKGNGVKTKCNASVTANIALMGDSTATTAQVVLATGVNPVVAISRTAYGTPATGFCNADWNVPPLP